MSENRFLWNSLDGGENVFIKERGSDKIIHIKIIEGKYEFVDFMKKVNVQQAEIEQLKDDVYDELDKALKVLEEIYDDYPKNNVHRLYNNLKGLKEMME